MSKGMTRPVHGPRGDGGFTVIELVVSIGIVGVLAAISAQNYRLYREGSYDSRETQIILQMKNALELGVSDYEESEPNGFVDGQSTTNSGSVVSWFGRALLPGFINPSNTWVGFWYDPFCTSGNPCIQTEFTVQDCDSDTLTRHTVWGDVGLAIQDSEAGWAC